VSLSRARAIRGCDLLVVEGPAGVRGLGLWLEVLEPRARHVVREGASLDEGVARMARRIAGRSVGLVLSGGGARALAHVGVIEELTAAGIVIDRVAGTSMGAFVGALLAMGLDPDEIEARCYEEWVRRSPLSDYRLPRVSVIRGRRAQAMFERTFPGSIEGLPLDFRCVSCDLVSGEMVVHTSGPLADAVGASAGIPGLVPPLARDGRLLVDGGVLNNLPVDVMAATGEGPLIAVDVTARSDLSALTEPGAPALTLRETLWRVTTLGSIDTAEAALRHADLVIEPVTDGIGLLEFHQLDAMRAEGRRAARAALAAAPAHLVGRATRARANGAGRESAALVVRAPA
jgi:predicted acylesterase/phospholipase RssA